MMNDYLTSFFPAYAHRPAVMGILNITPDSFHDGGLYLDTEQAVAQAQALAAAGADIIDIGAASSRPGYQPLTAGQELARLLPVLERLAVLDLPPLSVDTDKSEVAAAALSAGVRIINDTSGKTDSPCLELARDHQVPLIVMRRDRTGHAIAAEAEGFWQAVLQRADSIALPREQLIFDPGLGFNTTSAECEALLAAVPQFKQQGAPVLIGYSHKRFAAALTGEQPGNAPLANALLARRSAALGADIVRVHEVKEFLEALA